MKISCFLSDFEPFGMFVGGLLSLYQGENILQYKNSIEFYNKISLELENFLSENVYTVERISQWIGR